MKLNSDVQIAVTIRENLAHFLTRDDYDTQFKATTEYLAAPSVSVATLPLAISGTAIGALSVSFDTFKSFPSGERWLT